MDIKTTFLHGNLEEQIFMKVPDGVELKNADSKACLLKKSLYGLKQSPRQWYKRFDIFMMSVGFQRSKYDSCIYQTGDSNTCVLYLLLYVDDILIAGKSRELIEEVKKTLNKEFEMKDLGYAKRILGMDIHRSTDL